MREILTAFVTGLVVCALLFGVIGLAVYFLSGG